MQYASTYSAYLIVIMVAGGFNFLTQYITALIIHFSILFQKQMPRTVQYISRLLSPTQIQCYRILLQGILFYLYLYSMLIAAS